MFGSSNDNNIQVGYTMGMQDVPYAGGQPLNMQVDINVQVQVHGAEFAAPAGPTINPARFAEALDVVLNHAAAPAPPWLAPSQLGRTPERSKRHFGSKTPLSVQKWVVPPRFHFGAAKENRALTMG